MIYNFFATLNHKRYVDSIKGTKWTQKTIIVRNM